MNILGLVFSLLLILSYGFYVCWDKQAASSRLRTTYVGHEKVSRKILNSYQSEIYEKIRGKGVLLEPKEEEAFELEEGVVVKTPEPNRECAKINLWPLIQEGKIAHPALYEVAAKMIRTFYGSLHKPSKRFEYHFLDALLKSAKGAAALEKIDLNDPELQRIYYRMLKGTKKWDLASQVGYPSLLDYVCSSPVPSKICVFHAHPDLITVLFNLKIANRIYEEIHQQNGPLLTRELIERICSEQHLIAVDKELIELLELGKPSHEEHKKTFIAEDNETHVLLRKNIAVKGSA